MDAGEKMNQMAEKQNCCVKYNGRHVPRKNPAQMNLMQIEKVVKMYAFVASTPFGWKQNTYARAKCDADKDSNQKLVEAGPKLEPRATQDRSLSLHVTFKHVSSHGSKCSGQTPRLALFHLPKSRPFILNHGTISFILLVLLLTVPLHHSRGDGRDAENQANNHAGASTEPCSFLVSTQDVGHQKPNTHED